VTTPYGDAVTFGNGATTGHAYVDMDFGDAPDTYGTTIAANGARHIATGVTLGTQRDADANGQPGAFATGDGADDDGVTFSSPLIIGSTGTALVTASAPGKLDAWLDFNGNGVFDAGEKIANSIDVSTTPTAVTFAVTGTGGATFARFRVSSAGGLSPTGNWLRRKLDLNGDGDWSDASEVDDTGTFNKANEWLTRDLDSTSGTSGDNYSLTHDAAGNMTDDGKDYDYEYDVWGRLRKVKNQSSVLVAEYFYDGLGQRTGWHADWDADGAVETSNDDPWYMFVYDDRWRVAGTYRVASSATATSGTVDTYPKEQFIYHNAGTDGRGSSSYIDSVMLRDRDYSTAWTAAADSTVEERLWYGQNWRADVALMMNSNGRPLEKVKYSAYGVAMQMTHLDFNSDGAIDPDDPADFIGTPYDWDLDGDVDGTDSTLFGSDYLAYATAMTVRGGLSLSTISNRKGYAGYEFEPMTKEYHVRNRVYLPEMGRWTRRDPIGYVGGPSVYEYVASKAIDYSDPTGLVAAACTKRRSYLIAGGSQSDTATVWTRRPADPKLFSAFSLTAFADGAVLQQDVYVSASDFWGLGVDTLASGQLVNGVVIECSLDGKPTSSVLGLNNKRTNNLIIVNAISDAVYEENGTTVRHDFGASAAYSDVDTVFPFKIKWNFFEVTYNPSTTLNFSYGLGTCKWGCICCRWERSGGIVVSDDCDSFANGAARRLRRR